MRGSAILAWLLLFCLGNETFAQDSPTDVPTLPTSIPLQDPHDVQCEVKTESKLKQKLDQVVFNKKPLKEVVQYLCDVGSLNLMIDETSLTDLGITEQVEVSVDLKDVTMQQALEILLAPLEMTLFIDRDVVLLVSDDVACYRSVIVVYPIQDFLLNAAEGDQQIDELIRAIKCVDPDSWDGTFPDRQVSYCAGCLLVLQTPPVHEEVELLLGALRKSNQISNATFPSQYQKAK